MAKNTVHTTVSAGGWQLGWGAVRAFALSLLLAGFAQRFPGCYDSFRREGFGPIRAAWMSRAAGIGQPIEVRLEQETVAGRFSTLDEEGRLWLDLPDGSRRSFTAGDVFFPGL